MYVFCYNNINFWFTKKADPVWNKSPISLVFFILTLVWDEEFGRFLYKL